MNKSNDMDKWERLRKRANSLEQERNRREEKRGSSSVNSKEMNSGGGDNELDHAAAAVSLDDHGRTHKKVKLVSQKFKGKGKKARRPDPVLPPVIKLDYGTFISPSDELQSSRPKQHRREQVVSLTGDQPHLVSMEQLNNRKVAYDVSVRLKNFLRLSKAYKWVAYEWFYSTIDKVLLEGESDFESCLKESFPALKTRKLARAEWTKIRRMLGKPRRCSQKFFHEEREELAKRRCKIRQIQQRKVVDFSIKELPTEIPLQLVIGTKVTARLRQPQDGLFTGTVEGVDTSNNTYRITFDRPGLGTNSIPDFEVSSNDPPDMVCTSSFAMKIRKPCGTSTFELGKFKFQNLALLEAQPAEFSASLFPVDGMLGGFPVRLLEIIVRLSKLVKAKKEKIMSIKELNVEAEKMKSYGRTFKAEYKSRYARCVLDLDAMNKAIALYLEYIQAYCMEICNDNGSTVPMIIPGDMLDSSMQEASMVVTTYNDRPDKRLVHNEKIVGLVQQLTSLMLQLRVLSTADRKFYELTSLRDTMRKMKASLEGKNVWRFQNKIEIPMNRIIAGLCVPTAKP